MIGLACLDNNCTSTRGWWWFTTSGLALTWLRISFDRMNEKLVRMLLNEDARCSLGWVSVSGSVWVGTYVCARGKGGKTSPWLIWSTFLRDYYWASLCWRGSSNNFRWGEGWSGGCCWWQKRGLFFLTFCWCNNLASSIADGERYCLENEALPGRVGHIRSEPERAIRRGRMMMYLFCVRFIDVNLLGLTHFLFCTNREESKSKYVSNNRNDENYCRQIVWDELYVINIWGKKQALGWILIYDQSWRLMARCLLGRRKRE